MKTKNRVTTPGAEWAIATLSPEVVIQGPRLPKHLATIPDWIDPEQVNSDQVWSAEDTAKLTAGVSGTTAPGREIIQRVLWRQKKPTGARLPESLDSWRPLLNQDEFILLERIMARGEAEAAFIADNLWRVDYRRRPPSMQEFLTDAQYLGTMLHPERNGGIWPVWFKTLCEDFDRDSFLNNVVLTGAIGTGKTTVMVVILLYRICLLLLLKRPAEMFEQGAGSTLYFVIVSVTREAAQQTAFPQAVGLMAASPFFQNASGIRARDARSGGEVELTRAEDNETHTPVRLICGSKAQHLVGRNIIGIGFDEGNFRLEKEKDMAAFELYEAMRSRVLSRLKTREGYLPGITIIASSARDESSVTEQVRLEIEAAGNPREQRVFQKALYEVKPLPIHSLMRYFKVAYGLAHQEPTLVPGTFDAEGKLLDVPPAGTGAPLPPEAKIALVPTIYREAFERNCRQGLQEICGIASGGSGRLFPTMADVDRCLEISKQEGVPRTWRQDEVSISSEDTKNIWDFLDHRTFLTRHTGQIIPLRHPERLRYAHLDLATQSFAGMAICHLVGQCWVEGLIRDGQPFRESRLVVEYDVILAIAPGKTKPINFEKIQNLFLWLRQKCGFNFGLVSADQFQSEMPLQMLEAKGIRVGRLSIDKDKTAYRQWRAAFEEQRIRLALNERMYREASRLIEVDKKYDHPPNGTKDLTDAAAGAYLNAVNSDETKILGVYNTPGLHWGTGPTSASDPHDPPITIPLTPYSQSKKPRHFSV